VGLVQGERLLVTGVLTEASLAGAVVRLAVEEGAEVLLTAPVCRAHRVTSRVALRLGVTAAVLELDVQLPGDLAGLEAAVRGAGWDRVDGALPSCGALAAGRAGRAPLGWDPADRTFPAPGGSPACAIPGRRSRRVRSRSWQQPGGRSCSARRPG
jgi:hypothetical protein